jgi:hypothetical protein
MFAHCRTWPRGLNFYAIVAMLAIAFTFLRWTASSSLTFIGFTICAGVDSCTTTITLTTTNLLPSGEVQGGAAELQRPAWPRA